MMIHQLKRMLGLDGRVSEDPDRPARAKIHDDDLFLVSYPKSGNTWMRFMLANLLQTQQLGPEAEPINFNSAVQFVPEYELHTRQVEDAARPRILKSHAAYDPSFPRVAYLVRDPRDVYVSYYHYMRKRLPEATTFSDFIRIDGLHPCHWHEHVGSWVTQPNVLVIRYEDMLKDAAGQLRRLLDHGRHTGFSPAQVDAAVARSSFNRMKAIEQDKGRPFQSEQHRAQSTTFMRSGKANAWHDYFTPDDHAMIVNRMGPLMKRLGYATGLNKSQSRSQPRAA